MDWIFLSPHIDDIAISCGGLVWELAQAGERAQVWTVCAGDPPPGPLSPFAESLHRRWELGRQAAAQRRAEDLASCQEMHARPRHFSLPDCIYRTVPAAGTEPLQEAHLYASEEAIFGPLHPLEAPLVVALGAALAQDLPAAARVVCPLALGGHVDHRLTRQAAECLGRPLWYYADYPYAAGLGDAVAQACGGCQPVVYPLSEQGQQAWVRAVAAHRSQISTFWPDSRSLERALQGYRAEMGGGRLWKPLE